MGVAEAGSDPSSKGVAAKVDGVGWGVFFIWAGLALIADVGWAVFFAGTGVLMLAVQAIRRYLGLPVEWFSMLLGVVLVASGLSRSLGFAVDGASWPALLVPSVFIAIGVVLVVSAWRRRPGA